MNKNIYDMSINELIQELNLANSTRKEIRRLLKKKIKAHSNISLSNLTDQKLIELAKQPQTKGE